MAFFAFLIFIIDELETFDDTFLHKFGLCLIILLLNRYEFLPEFTFDLGTFFGFTPGFLGCL